MPDNVDPGWPAITISIVSHGQNALVNRLLEDLRRIASPGLHVILTENVPDPVPLALDGLRAEVVTNAARQGFGANHNAAFTRCATPLFCVANPDITLPADPFPVLCRALRQNDAAVVGPLVRNPAGGIEDSARVFPTPARLWRRALGERRGPDYPVDRGPVSVDWVAGMFMLFDSEAFAAVRGFDPAYFLYYEDADICRRLREAGQKVVYAPSAHVIHDARRDSHRRIGHALWHLQSMARFLRSTSRRSR